MKKFGFVVAITFGAALILGCLFSLSSFGKLTPEYDPSRQSSITAMAISPSLNDQREPAIYGTKVAWSEKIDNYWQVILFDLTNNSRRQLTSGPSDHVYPSISNDSVIWWQGEPGGANRVAGVNYITNQELVFPATQVTRPRIGDPGVVWVGEIDLSSLLSPVVYFDPATQQSKILSQTNGGNWPSISGSIAVWRDMRNGNGDIYGYDLTSGQEFPIVVMHEDQDNPDISSEIVVWQDNRASKSLTNYDLYGYDLRSQYEFVISARGGNEVYPKVSGNIVVWMDYVGSYVDVYAYDLKRQALITVAADNHANGYPAVSGTTIVWSQAESTDRNAHSQIMIAQLSTQP
jgi:beta propeller repeat protein